VNFERQSQVATRFSQERTQIAENESSPFNPQSARVWFPNLGIALPDDI
jgi:hypothetical protein